MSLLISTLAIIIQHTSAVGWAVEGIDPTDHHTDTFPVASDEVGEGGCVSFVRMACNDWAAMDVNPLCVH